MADNKAAAAASKDSSGTIETVRKWYEDAAALARRTRAATWWQDTLHSARYVSISPDATKEEFLAATRKANAQVDAVVDGIETEVQQMEAAVLLLAGQFDNAWMDMFYLQLGKIEINPFITEQYKPIHLACGFAAIAPLQDLVFAVRDIGKKLVRSKYSGEEIGCGWVPDGTELERWLLQTVDSLRERLYRERLVIEEKLQAVQGSRQTQTKIPQTKRTKDMPELFVRGQKDLVYDFLKLWHRYGMVNNAGKDLFRNGPVGVKELERFAAEKCTNKQEKPPSVATISRWFADNFKGHAGYERACNLNAIEEYFRQREGGSKRPHQPRKPAPERFTEDDEPDLD